MRNSISSVKSIVALPRFGGQGMCEGVNDSGIIVGWGVNSAISTYYIRAFLLKP